MNDIIAERAATLAPEWIAGCDEPVKLLGALADSLGDLERSIVTAAAIVRRLDELNIAIAVDIPALPWLRMVAGGSLLASVLSKFAGMPRLLNGAARLPIAEQREIVNGKPFRASRPKPPKPPATGRHVEFNAPRSAFPAATNEAEQFIEQTLAMMRMHMLRGDWQLAANAFKSRYAEWRSDTSAVMPETVTIGKSA